jgi:undecaprenyl-diphosphatase
LDNLLAILIGFSVAFITALFVVKAFVHLVGRYGFAPFAWYRIAIGSVALVWLYAL